MGGAEGGRHELQPAVRFSNVRKTYPGTQALKGVSLSIAPGSIHALVGENGSGKSTLIGVLGGKIAADPGGSVEVFGTALKQGSPASARELGVAVIHQELLIVPGLSAQENVHLGDLPHRGGLMQRNRLAAGFEALQGELGTSIPAHRAAGGLSVAQQTMLEIMRALRRRMRVLVLDEPSATLGVPDRERLYAVMRRLRAQGVALVLISHDLNEVLDIADEVSVLREGTIAGSGPRGQWTKESLVAAMLGPGRAERAFLGEAMVGGDDALDQPFGDAQKRTGRSLGVRNLRVGKVRVHELDLRPGEVVGIAGLVGSGRSTLLKTLAGTIRPECGTLLVDGVEARWPRNVRSALRVGVALMPEDRKAEGLVLGLPSTDNATISHLGGVARWSLLSGRRSRARATALLTPLAFRGRVESPVGSLSGGNQQKVLMAKWLHRAPNVLLIDEPTRGIDIGAKTDVMQAIGSLARSGRCVLWVSSELDEVVAVSDRVLIMAGGRVVDELQGARATVANALNRIFAATEGEVPEAGVADLTRRKEHVDH